MSDTRIISTSGYTSCACRDCFETAISNDVSSPDLCHECEEHGCDEDGLSECETPEEGELCGLDLESKDADPSQILSVLQQLSGDDNASAEDHGDGSFSLEWTGELDSVQDQIVGELETYGISAKV